MKKIHLVWIALAVAVVAWLVTRGGGPEAEIRARLAEVEEIMEKESGESSLAAAQRAGQLRDLLTDDFVVTLEPWGTTVGDERQLTRSFVGFRHGYQTIAVGLDLQEIELGLGERTADTSVRATFFGTGGPGPSRNAYDVVIRWRLDGGWKMAEVVVTGEAEGLF